MWEGKLMRLVNVKIENFRCFRDPIELNVGDLTSLIGKNDAGKSSIFEALDMFFNETKLENDDGSIFGNAKDVKITCEFEETPSKVIIDATNETSLDQEYLLNSSGRLVICRKYDGSLRTPKETGVYAIAQHPTTDDVKKLLQLKNLELKTLAKQRNVNLDGINQSKNAELRKAIWDACDDLALSDWEVPISVGGDAKKIWDNIRQVLPAFFLFKVDRPSTDQDSEAQDPMKAAIKLALDQKRETLDEIAEFVMEEVSRTADRTLAKVRNIDHELAGQLTPAFESPRWNSVFKVALKSDDGISINKRGSGVRRIVLLAFLQAQAEKSIKDDRSVIYAVEEPETSQHPDNQRVLYSALETLSLEKQSQVMITTHTPTLGRLLPVHSLRYLEMGTSGSRRILEGDEDTYRKIANSLGVVADHDIRIFVGVEGTNDINFLRGISSMLKNAGESGPDLSKLEDNGILMFVPLGGSNLSLWVTRLAGLARPEYYIFDRDAQPPEPPKYQEQIDAFNTRADCHAQATSKKEMENYIHPDAIKAALNVEVSFGDFDDVPDLVAQKVHEESESSTPWVNVDVEAKEKKKSRAKKRLNMECPEVMTPQMLDAIDSAGDIRSWLLDIASLVGE